MPQGVDAGDVHEQPHAHGLQVHRVLSGLLGVEAGELAQGRDGRQGVLGHHVQEDGVLLAQSEQVVAQGLGQAGVPVQGTKVEEDGGIEQGFRGRAPDPAGEALLPFLQGHAPLGVAGHDVAFAEGESHLVQGLIDLVGEGQVLLAFCFHLFRAAGHEDQAVVLVRGEGLLHPSFGTESQPAVAARQLVGCFHQGQDALGHPVVEGGDQVGELHRAHALQVHAPAGFADGGDDGGQGGHRFGLFDGGGQGAEAGPLAHEDVPFRNHPQQQTFVIDHRHVADAPGGHLQGGFRQGVGGIQGDRAGAHDPGRRQVLGAAQGQGAAHQVGLGDDAHGPALFHHHHRTRLLLGHQGLDGSAGLLGRHAQGGAPEQAAQGQTEDLFGQIAGFPVPGLAFAQLFQAPPGFFQQPAPELGRLLQGFLGLAAQLPAEGVVSRQVNVGRWPLPQGPFAAEQAARSELGFRRPLVGVFLAVGHVQGNPALLDDEQGGQVAPQIRMGQVGAPGIEHQPAVLEHQGEQGLGQPRQGRELLQGLQLMVDDHLHVAVHEPVPQGDGACRYRSSGRFLSWYAGILLRFGRCFA